MLKLKRPVLRGPAFILIGGFCLAFLGALGTVLATWSSREFALREWESRLSSVARMLSAHAGQSIGAADLILRGVADNVNEYGVRDMEEMRFVFSSRLVFDRLREAAKGLPQIDVVTVVAADGTVLNFTREFPAPPINLSDRDYFQAHMKDPNLDVFLSKPVQNRGNGTWTFYLARKIKSPSGETLGLILTGLHSKFFADFYESVGLGVSRVSLFRTDGSPLARQSSRPGVNFETPESEDIIRELSLYGRGVSLVGPNNWNKNGFREMTAFEGNFMLPVAVSISASRSEVLREWEHEAVKFVIEGGAMTGILLAATILLSRLISQLEQARNAALGAVEAKTRFASNVSHELRTPMNAIIGGSHQLMQTSLTQESTRYAQIVASAAQQLMVLINDILDYSYYEARNFRIEHAPLNVRELANNTIEMARALVPDSKLELICKVDARVPAMVIGDSGRIKQVLLNLLSNAVKFTDHGSVELRMSYVPGRDSQSNKLIIQVIDTGRGISREEQARIFQPFERGSSASKRPGTGLGLTISEKLVQAMSGTISLESAPGQGTRFTVELPAPPVLKEALPVPQESAAEVSRPHARALRILIAEDVAPNRMLLTLMLEKMGHAVTAVENGLEAVNAAQAEPFDLILMDLQMPELDGVSATKRIRQAGGINKGVRILAVSANADLDGPNGLASAGFDDTLLKPVSPARLDFVIAAIAGK